MPRKPFANLRRIAAAICTFALMAVALPAAASNQPLPVPPPANPSNDVIVIIPFYPEPVSPIAKKEFNVNGSFQWANASAQHYTIKFKNLRSGKVIRHTTPGICSEYCWLSEASVGLRTTYRDGDIFTWQVIAKMENGTTVKSSKAKAIFNEVDAAALLGPANNNETDPLGSFSFSWSDSTLAKEFTLIVRDAETGAVVIKAKGERFDWCSLVCTYMPDYQQRAILQDERLYKWQIKTLGMTNEKAKSAVHNFTWNKLIG